MHIKISKEFTPKFFTLIKEKNITPKNIRTDFISGIIVGIVALPLAIAFAIASGLSPEKGLVTAIVAGFIISAFGGSRVQIGGPTGAFIVMVYGIVAQFGISGLIISTLMAGFLLIALGLAKFGNYLKFIPYPLIVGFTSGIALIIFSSQINDFLGLNIQELPPDFVGKWNAYLLNFGHVNYVSFAIAMFSLLVTKSFHRVTAYIPGSVVAIVFSTLAVALFNLPVATIESLYGEIPRTFSLPEIPELTYDLIMKLIQPAFAIAMLAAIESLLSAVVADGMIGAKHRSNQELVALGAANIFSAIFGGMPATGAIARTATNVKNGGRTPIAGITHAIVLLLIMLIFAPYAKLIPMASLAGILVVVAYNMSEWRQFRSLLRSSAADKLILLSTFFLTVVFDLVLAIEIGLVLSSFLFMKRMSDSLQIQHVLPEHNDEEVLFGQEIELLNTQKVTLYEINGPLFFGAAQQFQDSLLGADPKPQVVILRMRYVPLIDATGYARLKEIIKNFNDLKVTILLSGVNEDLRNEFRNNKFCKVIGSTNVFADIQSALKYAKKIIE